MADPPLRFPFAILGKDMMIPILKKTDPKTFSRFMRTETYVKKISEKMKIKYRKLIISNDHGHRLIETDVITKKTEEKTLWTIELAKELKGKDVHWLAVYDVWDTFRSEEFPAVLIEALSTNRVPLKLTGCDLHWPPAKTKLKVEETKAFHLIKSIGPASIRGDFFMESLRHHAKMKQLYLGMKRNHFNIWGWIKDFPHVEIIFSRGLPCRDIDVMFLLAFESINDLDFGRCSFVSLYIEGCYLDGMINSDNFLTGLNPEFQFDGVLRRLEGVEYPAKKPTRRNSPFLNLGKPVTEYGTSRVNVPLRIFKHKNSTGKEIGLAFHAEENWAYLAIVPNFEDTQQFL